MMNGRTSVSSLIHTYTKKPDGWCLTASDFSDGAAANAARNG
jgi:hypothetical protein